MTAWLRKPYPQIEETRLKLAVAFGMGMVCFLFLLIFKPFGLADIPNNSAGYIFGFGCNCTIALLISYFVLPKLFPKLYNPDRWKIYNELGFYLIILFIISVLNYLYNTIILAGMTPQHGLIMFVYFTSAVGVIPIALMTYITERVARQRNLTEAQGLNNPLSPEPQTSSTKIQLLSDTVKSEHLELSLHDFIYAQSSGNYTQIYFRQNDVLSHKLLRCTLKRVTEQLSEHQSIVRCHKSYIINKDHIEDITGNARSLIVKLSLVEQEIPVSRSFDYCSLRSL